MCSENKVKKFADLENPRSKHALTLLYQQEAYKLRCQRFLLMKIKAVWSKYSKVKPAYDPSGPPGRRLPSVSVSVFLPPPPPPPPKTELFEKRSSNWFSFSCRKKTFWKLSSVYEKDDISVIMCFLVFLKLKSKMTADCSVFKLLWHSEDGALANHFFYFFMPCTFIPMPMSQTNRVLRRSHSVQCCRFLFTRSRKLLRIIAVNFLICW